MRKKRSMRHLRSVRPRLESLEKREVPAVLTVTTLLDGIAGSLRAEVFQAQDGDTIQFTDGLSGQITLTGGAITINNSIDISGPGLGVITVSGNHAGRIFNVPADPTVAISGLTLADGRVPDQGGAIDNLGTLSISGTIFRGNSAAGTLGGGAIYNAGTLSVDTTILVNNSAPVGGGIYNDEGTLAFSGSTLVDNAATQFDGGGLYIHEGTVTISDSTIAGNSCRNTLGGGGIYNAGILTIRDSALASNSATGTVGTLGGGAIFNNGTLAISDSTFTNNLAARGGAIDTASNTSLTIDDSTLTGNVANSGTGSLGGAIYGNGTLTISDSIISGNTAAGAGGIWLQGATMMMSGSTLAGNSTTLFGGGITISVNCSVTVSNSTIAGNATGGVGGGIHYDESQPGSFATFTNVTITGNRDNTAGGPNAGGGIDVTAASILPPVLHNTLIAGNFNGGTGANRDDVSGRVDTGSDYNLIGDGNNLSGISNSVNGNQVGPHSNPINPLVGTLSYTGGPTQTIPVLAGSPALDAGAPDQLGAADQRGAIRSGGVNIGAYQASASVFNVTTVDSVQAGSPFDVTVAAVDIFGQPAVGYTGTITFSTSDEDRGVVLPADYTFALTDGGSHTFSNTGLGETTLITPGDQTITVMDTADNSIAGTAIVTVSGTAPGPGQHAPNTGATGGLPPVLWPSASTASQPLIAGFVDEGFAFYWSARHDRIQSAALTPTNGLDGSSALLI